MARLSCGWGWNVKNADKTITVYNFYLDPETGYDVSKRTQIDGVSAFCQTKVNVSKDGMASADVFTIRIPEEVAPGYASPKEFAALTDKTGRFTLSKGDKIVIGVATEESPTQSDLEKKYDTVVTITGVTDNRGKRSSHWKVTGE